MKIFRRHVHLGIFVGTLALLLTSCSQLRQENAVLVEGDKVYRIEAQQRPVRSGFGSRRTETDFIRKEEVLGGMATIEAEMFEQARR